MRVLIIIPTYNEANNIRPLLESLIALQIKGAEILVVDDNSPDCTGEIVEGVSRQNPLVHLVTRTSSRGYGCAYLEAFRWAFGQAQAKEDRHYDLFIQMDGDFSHQPKDLLSMLVTAEAADVVIGSRYVEGIRVLNWSLGRLLLSIVASYYVRWLTGVRISDPTSGFRALRRSAVECILSSPVRSNGYSFQIETNYYLWQRGFKFVEEPITFMDRFRGSSKFGMKIIWEAVFVVLRLSWWRIIGCPRSRTSHE